MSKKCTHCNSISLMRDIPLVAAENEAMRQHAVIRKLLWVIILLVTLLFGSNLAWIVYDKQCLPSYNVAENQCYVDTCNEVSI